MKKTKKFSTILWGKGLVILLVIMFLFTLISRTAASFTVAKVCLEAPSSRKVLHSVAVEGRIVKNREVSVLTEPDIRVKSVLVDVGQRVKKGDVLAKLDLQDLVEQIESIKGEKEALELQNQAVRQNQNQAEKKRQRDVSLAKKEYERLKKRNKAAIDRAAKEVSKAEKAWKAAASEKSASERKAALEEKKKNYKTVRSNAKAAEKEAKKAIYEADVEPAADHSVQVNNIAIEKLDRQIGKRMKLQKNKGQILAPRGGVITSILVNVGQKTADTGVCTMTDDKAGLKFEGQLGTDEAAYVSPGDAVKLSAPGGEEKEAEVTSLEMDESKEFMLVTALLPAHTFSLGETATMRVTQESHTYACTVPLSALRQENGTYYVLTTEVENTVLGEQLIAVKEEVKVLEKNEMLAALDSDSLGEDSRIITDTDRYVEAGDRVRLKEE